MKSKLKLSVGLILMVGLIACEKDELDSIDSSNPDVVDKETNNDINGMIKSYSSDAVLKWNEALSEVLDNRLPQPADAKIYTMVTLAMHDALNNVVPMYETYALKNLSVETKDISKDNIQVIADAAVAQAAHDVLFALFPPSRETIGNLLERSLGEMSDQESKARGVSIGAAAAASILTKRQTDAPLGFESFVGPTGPGQYQADYMPFAVSNGVWPDNAVYSPDLGDLTPFGIKSGDQFRNESPYPISSSEYVQDYNEVKRLGCNNCPERTAEQTEIGTFWIENNSSLMNRIARTLIVKQELDGWEAARLIGLVQMAIMDAYIASFDGKRHFNLWRPVTAIRTGNSDGNPETTGDPSWTSLFNTPPTPEFPSTHSTTGGAAAAIFKHYFKKDLSSFKATSPFWLPGVQRTINSFSQIADENAISRVYIGYHFRYATVIGKKQGRLIGRYIFENNLREIKKI